MHEIFLNILLDRLVGNIIQSEGSTFVVSLTARGTLGITTLKLSTLSISSHGFALGFPKMPHTNGDSIPPKMPHTNGDSIPPKMPHTNGDSIPHLV